MNPISDIELELDELWIDAIPEDPYDKCPCDCGRKFKFVKEEIGIHERKFKDNCMREKTL